VGHGPAIQSRCQKKAGRFFRLGPYRRAIVAALGHCASIRSMVCKDWRPVPVTRDVVNGGLGGGFGRGNI